MMRRMMFKRARWLVAPVAAALALAGCGGAAQHGTSAAPLQGGRVHSTQFLQQVRQPAAQTRGLFSLTPSLPGYDAVTTSAIPADSPVVGCYVSGPFANCSAAHADHPNARLVTIATFAGYQGPAKILDTEPGDAVPSQDAGFILTEIRVYHVYRPGVYADASEMVQVQADLAAAGIPRADYVLWVARWDGNPAIPAGFDAKQWNSSPSVDFDSFAITFFAPAPPTGPTKPQVNHWRGARNSSFTAYHRDKCTVALKGNCRLFGHRVTYFQGKLWTVAPRWACFGKKARDRALVCWIVRPLANYYSHAYLATVGAYQRNTCDGPEGLPSPSHSRLCDVLRQRRSYEYAHATALVKAYG